MFLPGTTYVYEYSLWVENKPKTDKEITERLVNEEGKAKLLSNY